MTAWQNGFAKTAGLWDKGIGAAKKLVRRGAEAPLTAAAQKLQDRAFLAANPIGGRAKLHPEGVNTLFNVSGIQMKRPLSKTLYSDVK